MKIKDKKLYIFDKDGTLTLTKNGYPCPSKPGETFLLPNVFDKISSLHKDNKLIAVATNQGGVSHGYMEEMDAWMVLKELRGFLSIDEIAVSFYEKTGKYKDYYLDKSKPDPGMIYELMKKLFVDNRSDVLMIGDGFVDKFAAENAGVDFMFAHEFFGWNKSMVKRTEHGYTPQFEWSLNL